MRALGLDLGRRRIGVAVSDDAGILAVPHGVVRRVGDQPVEHAEIVALAGELGVGVVVVGLPLTMDGDEDVAAKAVRSECRNLARRLAVPVELHDERLSTVEAARTLDRAGVRRRRQRERIDETAATVILQSWLDGPGGTGSGAGG